MAKNCIGLDIGSSSVKAVQLKKGKRGLQLQAFGVEPLMPQTIVDGTIMDQSAVVDAVRTLWSRLRLKSKDVAIAIAGHSVIIKKISVPPMNADELAEQIPYEAEHHIPFAKDDVELDYEVVNWQNAGGQMELILVAAKKEVVADYTQVVRDAGLNPVVVDVAAFSSQNAFELSYTLDPQETAVLINVGAAISNINIVRGNASLFTRDVTIGGNAFTEEIQKQLNVSQDEAEAYKVGGSHDEHGVVPQEVERIIEGVAEVMAGEFQRSLDFFLATAADTNVSRIMLAGGTAKVAALHRAIERRSRLTVEVVDAWKRVEIDSKLDAGYLAAHAPEAMVGLGLAMRTPTDKGAGGKLPAIKINLLPQRKSRRVDKGQQSLLVGMGAVAAAAALVFLLVHRPLAGEVDTLKQTNSALKRDNDDKKKRLEGFAELKAQVEAERARAADIIRLDRARAVPAHLLNELSTILTPGEKPTMTQAMARRVQSDPNRELTPDWDPKHVWISEISEKEGRFRLSGGAQSDGDMTEFSKRLTASAFFDEVVPEGGVETIDKNTGVTFYSFTVTGRVVY